jgi:hypothetical protein
MCSFFAGVFSVIFWECSWNLKALEYDTRWVAVTSPAEGANLLAGCLVTCTCPSPLLLWNRVLSSQLSTWWKKIYTDIIIHHMYDMIFASHYDWGTILPVPVFCPARIQRFGAGRCRIWLGKTGAFTNEDLTWFNQQNHGKSPAICIGRWWAVRSTRIYPSLPKILMGTVIRGIAGGYSLKMLRCGCDGRHRTNRAGQALGLGKSQQKFQRWGDKPIEIGTFLLVQVIFM